MKIAKQSEKIEVELLLNGWAGSNIIHGDTRQIADKLPDGCYSSIITSV